MIGKVEHLSTELCLDALCYVESLEYRDIKVTVVRANDVVTVCIAHCSGRLYHVCIWVEEVRDAFCSNRSQAHTQLFRSGQNCEIVHDELVFIKMAVRIYSVHVLLCRYVMSETLGAGFSLEESCGHSSLARGNNLGSSFVKTSHSRKAEEGHL